MPATAVKTPVVGDPWESDKSTWEYVSIPAENAIGEEHASISISGPHQMHLFERGKTYLIPRVYAETVRERLKAYASSRTRVYTSARDMRSVLEQAKSGIGSAQMVQATGGGANEVTPVQPG